MMLGDKEKSMRKTPINRKKKNPRLSWQVSAINLKHKWAPEVHYVSRHCGREGDTDRRREPRAVQKLPVGGCQGLRARDGEQLGARDRYTHTRFNTIFLWKM